MKNTAFNNPFRCSLRTKDGNNITISKKIELELDSSVLIKKQNGELISLNDLQEGDRLDIIVSPIAPHKAIEIELLPKPLTPSA
jgi:hypothetical protein